MKTTKLDFPVMSSWMENNGRRLDCNPYLSGAFEAKVLLEKLPVKKEQLKNLTKGGVKGIFNGPRFSRVYVEDPAQGIPLLSGGEMLQADLSFVPLISKRQIETMPYMLLEKGTTLITSYGTIGKTVYCRSDMAGMVGSDNVMKVVPENEKILPGYLFAFLSSQFGIPLITSGTSGSIITFLDPSRIAELPVPRLTTPVEEKAHQLIEKAANNRFIASRLLVEASQDFINYFRLNKPKPNYKYYRPSTNLASSYSILQRMDAYYFAEWNEDAYREFTKVPVNQRVSLGEITADLYIPNIFKRIYAENHRFGYPYITGADVYCLAPTSDRYLSKKVPDIHKLVLRDGMILVQDSGQIGGLIGRPVAVSRHLDGFACTNNMVRIVPHSKIDQGYIFALLNTEYGIRLLTREATGSSIPHLDEKRIKKIQIPWTDSETRELLGRKVLQAIDLRDEACDLETEAIAIVDNAIRDGGA